MRLCIEPVSRSSSGISRAVASAKSEKFKIKKNILNPN
jgi:hypothetical protein